MVQYTFVPAIRHPSASFVCNTSVIRQPTTSGLVEITRNSVSPYRSFRDASHTYTNPSSLSLALSPTHFHASLPPSVPALLCPCPCPSRAVFSVQPAQQIWLRMHSGSFRRKPGTASAHQARLLTQKEALVAFWSKLHPTPPSNSQQETCGPQVSLHCP